MSELSIQQEQMGDVVIFRITGNLWIGEASVALRVAVRNALSAGHRKFVWDLSGVKYIDSSGSGELITSYIATGRAGGSVVLCHVNQTVQDSLAIQKVLSVLDVFDDLGDALNQLSVGRGFFPCPIYGCGKSVTLPLYPPNHVSICCSACRAEFQAELSAAEAAGGMRCEVRSLRIPAYPEEYVNVIIGLPSIIEITNRLDLFVSETIRTARNVIPLPRRILFDISEVRDITSSGLNALHLLCVDDEENSKAVILREASEVSALTTVPVYSNRDAALAALSETMDEVLAPMTVCLKGNEVT